MDYQNKLNEIINIFSKSFSEAYTSSRAIHRTKLLIYSASFFRRWLFSDTIEDTMLSPANIVTVINREIKDKQLVSPMIKPVSTKKYSGFVSVLNTYSLDNHLVVNDLKTFIASCTPDVSVDEQGFVLESHALELLDNLSIYDPFYVKYLNRVANSLGLLKKAPAIYSNRYQTTEKVDKLFAKTPREIFDAIFEATASAAVAAINEILPLNKKIINLNFIKDLLKNPVSTDEVFGRLYSSMGIDLDMFFNQDLPEDDDDMPIELDEVYNLVMSSTFFLGVAIDEFFFTPFGYYLKLITPEYIIPYDFEGDISFTQDTIKEGGDIEVSMFSPCSDYYVTKLGCQYFDVTEKKVGFSGLPNKLTIDEALHLISQKDETEINVAGFEEHGIGVDLGLNFDDTILKLFSSGGLQGLALEGANEFDVFEIKVSLASDKGFWKNVEIQEMASLHELYEFLVDSLEIKKPSDYCFYSDLPESAFTKYSSPKSKTISKKADEATLMSLGLLPKQKFLLELTKTTSPVDGSKVKELQLSLEVLKKKEGKDKVLYPRVSRVSKEFKD